MAVGQFTLEITAIPSEVQVGEPVTITMTLNGDGNLDTVTAPQLIGDTSHFKSYDPKLRPNNTTAHTTHKIFEQVLIPLDPTVQAVPPIQFSYFSPSGARYITLTKGPIPLRVTPAPVQAPLQVIEQRSGELPGVPETLGRDIIYIKETLGELRHAGQTWYRSAWWWWFGLSPLLLLLGVVGLTRYRERLAADPGAMRASGALKRALAKHHASRRLAQHQKVTEAYAELFRAVQEYIGDRFNLTSEGLTTIELEQHLRPRGIPEELLNQLLDLFNRCDAARFAPRSSAVGQIDATLTATASMLKQLDRWKPT